MLVTAVAVAAAGAWGVSRAADQTVAEVERVSALDGVLAPLPGQGPAATDESGQALPDVQTYPARNYLLVGSDSREGVSADDEDYAIVGSEAAVGGRRSDTIMVLRQEENGGLSLMSLPRDLWVEIAGTGHKERINTAFNGGADRLIATVSQSLGIPIHYYVEVDFLGFKEIIDELGGVELCIGYPARDVKSGLALDAGCQVLDGVQALAYARSRTYEEWDGDSWNVDGRADLGRIERQQLFIRAAIDGTLRRMQSDPFGAGDLINAVAGSVRIDERLDPFEAAATLRSAVQDDGIRTFRLPVSPEMIDGKSVLELGKGSSEVLAYFAGTGPAPTEFETTADTAAATSGASSAAAP
jgi:LCP family protein required for cell wall assembly